MALARVRRLALLTAVAAIAPLCLVGVALTANSWWEGLIIAAGLAVAGGVLREWSVDGYPRRAVFAAGFTGVNWLVGALVASSPMNFVPFALVGALLLARAPSRRLPFSIALFSLAVALLGTTALLTRPPTWPLAVGYVVLPTAGTVLIAGVIVASEQAWLVVRRLERAKQTEEELAVARERMRFAGDLHDIQGHSLHVVKLKTARVRALLPDEPDHADEELIEIARLVDDTIAHTRTLAHAQHQLNLAAELENAKRLCEAAGITTDVRSAGDLGRLAHPLLAQVLREATTNLLRHARPSTVSIDASPHRVVISNDGASPEPTTELRGLARLRDRVRDAGGTMQLTHTSDTFTLVADLDPGPGAGSPSPGAGPTSPPPAGSPRRATP